MGDFLGKSEPRAQDNTPDIINEAILNLEASESSLRRSPMGKHIEALYPGTGRKIANVVYRIQRILPLWEEGNASEIPWDIVDVVEDFSVLIDIAARCVEYKLGRWGQYRIEGKKYNEAATLLGVEEINVFGDTTLPLSDEQLELLYDRGLIYFLDNGNEVVADLIRTINILYEKLGLVEEANKNERKTE